MIVTGTMDSKRDWMWWFPFAFGIVFFVEMLLAFFDPTEATLNPYNFFELYAEAPMVFDVSSWVGILGGFLGILAIVAIEFAYSKPGGFRPLRGPIRFIAFVLVWIGFYNNLIGSIRSVEIVPDMAHYYHAQDGELRDVIAMIYELGRSDRNDTFMIFGGGIWCLILTTELIRANRVSRYLGITGISYGAGLLVYYFVMLTDMAKPALMLLPVVFLILMPLWFISTAIHIRGNSYDASHRTENHKISEG